MLEITYTDLFLFAWASVMTALYFKARHEAHMARVVFAHFLENPEEREEMLSRFDAKMKESA